MRCSQTKDSKRGILRKRINDCEQGLGADGAPILVIDLDGIETSLTCADVRQQQGLIRRPQNTYRAGEPLVAERARAIGRNGKSRVSAGDHSLILRLEGNNRTSDNRQ